MEDISRNHTTVPEPLISDAHRRKGLFFLGLAMGCVGFTLAMQMGLNANFLAEDIGVSGFQLGLLEAFRESCGVTALLVLAVLAGLAEPVVGAVMLVLVAVGLSGYASAHDYTHVVLASLVWSMGLHVWMPLPHSMALALAEKGRSGHRLGQTQAAYAAGFAAGLVAALVLTLLSVPMRPLYLLAAGAALAGATLCLAIPRKIKTPGPRLVFRKKYRLYYALSFLEGWRKQISICFAGFLLVRVYDTPLHVMLILWIAVQVISYFAAPAVGKIIDRIGERKVLLFYYACLGLFFVGYATIGRVYVLYGLFVLDNAFFVFVMSLTTYANRMAPRSELTQTLSMGVAMNHAAAVIMPLAGGVLWKFLGYQSAFLVGALAAGFSILTVLYVPKHLPAKPAPVPPLYPTEDTPEGRV